MTDVDDFEAVKGFFSAYFHEDWCLDADDSTQVVAAYLRERPDRVALGSIARGIQLLVERHVPDEELEKVLFREFGCYYLPSADGRSARAWLQQVGEEIRIASATPTPLQ